MDPTLSTKAATVTQNVEHALDIPCSGLSIDAEGNNGYFSRKRCLRYLVELTGYDLSCSTH